MLELLLARHGETAWNVEGRVQGHTDLPLNESGIAQAEALATQLAAEPLVAVHSSDLLRARATASAVASRHGLDVVLDPDLREKNFGSWEGMTDTEIRERHPDALRGTWGDGESSEAVARRAVAAIERIRSQYTDGTVLVVSHGGALRAILDHLEVPHERIDNCAIFRADV